MYQPKPRSNHKVTFYTMPEKNIKTEWKPGDSWEVYKDGETTFISWVNPLDKYNNEIKIAAYETDKGRPVDLYLKVQTDLYTEDEIVKFICLQENYTFKNVGYLNL